MHELGVVIEVVKTVERIVVEQKLNKVYSIVLQIGELSSMIPRYIEQCYPAAVDGTLLQDTKLEIEVLPANVLCSSCNKVFNIVDNGRTCPNCGGNTFSMLSGREFMIKEIIAY
ncbi:Probable hydrogenase nickel incorporation protein hypA [uncultured Clostridium sp.]|uniref:hydrogenase maturation nickel metallochaperone HypA/HybF n=1 Tax=uncultured Clostridium sp. TaxID=59620 RepID=UPI0008214AFD|nr:hydrogenase maturation nickel metallochaperone HypA [uncultured Clostridium sp.]SCJ60175.1 Probable hydrogenase nickel incorporation protein hypA [uncultured Clostridium sp.]